MLGEKDKFSCELAYFKNFSIFTWYLRALYPI